MYARQERKSGTVRSTSLAPHRALDTVARQDPFLSTVSHFTCDHENTLMCTEGRKSAGSETRSGAVGMHVQLSIQFELSALLAAKSMAECYQVHASRLEYRQHQHYAIHAVSAQRRVCTAAH